MIAGAPLFADDEIVLPLQVAHNIAWLHRKFAEQHNITTGDLGAWKPSEPCLKKLGQIGTIYAYCPYELMACYFNKARQ